MGRWGDLLAAEGGRGRPAPRADAAAGGRGRRRGGHAPGGRRAQAVRGHVQHGRAAPRQPGRLPAAGDARGGRCGHRPAGRDLARGRGPRGGRGDGGRQPRRRRRELRRPEQPPLPGGPQGRPAAVRAQPQLRHPRAGAGQAAGPALGAGGAHLPGQDAAAGLRARRAGAPGPRRGGFCRKYRGSVGRCHSCYQGWPGGQAGCGGHHPFLCGL
mmetsp:Transcript_11757/g.18065  ORF Transcript_11757/g.18065 Transcript_11757/m.18065 type:complete len:213 (+) Transcript_11757:600-1238(+)